MDTDCHDGCGQIASERLRYFTGRHMTARDFRDEQAYHRTHRLLHNRMLHGWGVVCGLRVVEHPNPSCRDRVKVHCGFALDCCGREVAIEKDVVPPPIPWDQRKAPYQPRYKHSKKPDPNWYLLLCLAYRESETECVPVLYNEQDCDPQRREHSRVKEGFGFEWHWVREAELPDYHWKVRRTGCADDHPCHADDCSGDDGTKRCCLEPKCPPHHCVPLALIRVKSAHTIDPDDIEMSGRPSLEPFPEVLTHICGINWTHGGEVERRHVKDLRVHFDRRLRPSGRGDCGGTGINACTFIVQFGGGYEDLDFVTCPQGQEPYLDNECVAVFPIDPRGRRRRHDEDYGYLEKQIVFVTIKCDFVLDCNDIPVDGNHLGGLLPTGDGIRGGTFESWFRVIPDRPGYHHSDSDKYDDSDSGSDGQYESDERERS